MDAQTTYNYKVVRQFTIMTVVWGIVGMAVGVLIAAQLVWPALNFDLPFLTYSRLRPLHTNAVIFAFGGCALFATSYYSVQRTCHAPLFAPGLAAFTFWGWQLIIVLAALSLPLGFTTGKEYAELEWPIDIDRNSFGLAGQAGVDFKVADNWFVNLDAKYVKIEAKDVRITGGALAGTKVTDLKIDPWLLSVGVGYRF